MTLENLNLLTIAISAPILIPVGMLGFIIPADKSPSSYNIFTSSSL
jgi:hypothetical protein